MNKLVISGYYGFGNAGDEALLAAILEALLEVEPNLHITVISGNPKETERIHGVNAIGRFDVPRIYKAIQECEMLISGGGSLLQDVTSTRSLYYYLSIISLANQLGKKVMIYAQGIGPLRKAMARKAVGKILNSVTTITVRDHVSKEELLSMGVTNVPIEVTADAVLGMHPVDQSIGNRLLQNFHLCGTQTKIGVSVRAWKDCDHYRQQLGSALDTLQEEKNCKIVFIPMQHPEDTEESKAIAQYMRHKPILLEQSYTTTELLSLTGCMDMVIGVRLHALIFSTLMGTPCIGISYDPKIDNFLHMIGENPVGSLENLSPHTLVSESISMIERGNFQSSTLKNIAQLRRDALENARIAISLFHKK